MDATIQPGTLEIEGLPSDDREWIVAWYVRIERNVAKRHEPVVAVLLKEYQGAGDMRLARIGFSHLGQVRLNSVWRHQRLVRNLLMTTRTFRVDGCAHFRPVGADAVAHLRRISPSSSIGNLLTRKSAVEFTDGGIRFLFPSLELFSRCYGQSEYLRMVLATLPFDEALHALFARDAVPEEPGQWLVTLAMNCYDGDAVFLAHLKHDVFTRERVRALCGQFQTARAYRGEMSVVPAIRPWWPGFVSLRCSGLEYRNEPGTFVVFRIDAMEQPAGPTIHRDRQNTNRIEYEESSSQSGALGSGGWNRPRKNPDGTEPDELVHTQEPSWDYAPRAVLNPALEILGKPRAVLPVIRIQEGRKSGGSRPEPEPGPSSLSSGSATRSGLDQPAPASIATPTSTLIQDVWRAFHSVVPDYDGSDIVAWSGTDWVPSHEPIGVPMLADDVQHAHPWYYIHDQDRSRRFYLARANINGRMVHVLELERRLHDGSATEELCGVGFVNGDLDVASGVCGYAAEHGGVLKEHNLDLRLLRHRYGKDGTLKSAIRTLLQRLVGKPRATMRRGAASADDGGLAGSRSEQETGCGDAV